MKKIISMICVVAMMFSFAVISASANNASVELVKNESLSNADLYVYDVIVNSEDNIKNITVQLKYSDFLTKNTGMTTSDFSAEKVDGTAASNVANNQFVTSNYMDVSMANTTVTLFRVKIATANFKNDAAFTLTANTKVNGAAITSSSGLEIAAPVSGPSITYNHSANVSAALGWKGYDEEITDDQIGLGFKYEGVVPSGATAMRWGAYIDGARKYSPVINWSEFGIAAGSNVTFYSTYIYGEHNGTPDEAALTAASNALAPSASFKTAAGYVTTESN